MPYKVPKFLEREAHIFGPLTFKHLAYFGIAGVILLILWYTVSRLLFAILFFLVSGAVFSLVFLKIEGVPLIQVIPYYFEFFSSVKTFIWRRKEVLTPIKLVERKEKTEEKKDEAALKLAPESKLRKLGSKLEIGLK